MQKSCYQAEYIGPTYSSEYDISNLEETGTIIFITDPSGADIYVDEVLKSAKTSTSLIIPTGNRTVTYVKAGYESYTQVVSGLKRDQVIKVCAILGKIADIIDSGIVICTTTGIASCPTMPIACPTTINPLDYINLIAKINSTKQKIVTVRFTYTLDDTTYSDNVVANLIIGNNIVYAWSTNRRYNVDTVVTLIDVSLV